MKRKREGPEHQNGTFQMSHKQENRMQLTLTTNKEEVMNKTYHKTFKSLTGAVVTVALALPLLFASARPAEAVGPGGTAAGTKIQNAVSVSYAESTTPVTASVTVVVNLVSSVSLSAVAPASQTIDSGTKATDYTLTITNTGNGTDTFSITDGTTPTSNLSGTFQLTVPANVSTHFTGTMSPYLLKLVGTIASQTVTSNTVVPVGNVDTTAIINTVTTVRINGSNYVVDSATATTLTLHTAVTLAAGDQIGEIVTLTYKNTTVDALVNNTSSGTFTHSLTATDDVGSSKNIDGNASASFTTAGGWVTTVEAGTLTITKYVRNSTSANTPKKADGAAGLENTDYTKIEFPTGTFYYTPMGATPASVKGTPADNLEYLIVIKDSNGGGVNNVILIDTIPTDFITLDPTTISLDKDGDKTFDATGIIIDPVIKYTAPVITVYAGTNGNGSTSTGGHIAKNGVSYVKYTAAIK